MYEKRIDLRLGYCGVLFLVIYDFFIEKKLEILVDYWIVLNICSYGNKDCKDCIKENVFLKMMNCND